MGIQPWRAAVFSAALNSADSYPPSAQAARTHTTADPQSDRRNYFFFSNLTVK